MGDNTRGLSNSGASTTYLAIIYDRLSSPDMDVMRRTSKIQVGQKVEITAGALPTRASPGVVDKININGTTNQRPHQLSRYRGRWRAPEALYPAMNVSAKIIGEAHVPALPVEAVECNTALVAGRAWMKTASMISAAESENPGPQRRRVHVRSWTAWRRAKWRWRARPSGSKIP